MRISMCFNLFSEERTGYRIYEACKNIDPTIAANIVEMITNNKSKQDIIEYVMINVPFDNGMIEVMNIIESS